MKPVCLVIGAGAGIGGNVGMRFAAEGYHSVLCRRSDQYGLDKLVADIQTEGGEATGFLLNAIQPDTIEKLVEAIERDTGPIETVIYNLGAQIGDRALADTSYKAFEMGWRIATQGLFRLASSVCPLMEARGHGSIIVTSATAAGPGNSSATAAVLGNSGQHSHASAMGGRRMLCQSLNAEMGPKGIHIAHVLIDGAVDAPDTLGKMLGPEQFQALRESRGLEHDGLMLPAKIAETYLHLAQQHRSTWTHEIDLRSFTDLAWWNH